jgi:hypothetical protein
LDLVQGGYPNVHKRDRALLLVVRIHLEAARRNNCCSITPAARESTRHEHDRTDALQKCAIVINCVLSPRLVGQEKGGKKALLNRIIIKAKGGKHQGLSFPDLTSNRTSPMFWQRSSSIGDRSSRRRQCGAERIGSAEKICPGTMAHC